MARHLIPVVLALSLVACSGPPPDGVGDRATGPTTSAEPSASATPSPAVVVDRPLPTAPASLAERLTTTTTSLDGAIERWRSEGDTGAWPPPDDVVVLALDQQRIYQVLAGHRSIRRRTLALLPRDIRARAAPLAAAGARLASAATPVRRLPRIRTAEPLPPDLSRTYYDAASARFGVGWELLAAVHFIETRFGRVVSNSVAGARGPMQFIPSTWAAYGLGGNVRDPRDAIMGAANYLSASGAPGRERRALLAYNPADFYADAVGLYADAFRRHPDTFYALYNWQVFVRTPSGDLRRLTGPGLSPDTGS